MEHTLLVVVCGLDPARNDPPWSIPFVQVHRLLMLLAIPFTIVGFVVIFVSDKGFLSPLGVSIYAHDYTAYTHTNTHTYTNADIHTHTHICIVCIC